MDVKEIPPSKFNEGLDSYDCSVSVICNLRSICYRDSILIDIDGCTHLLNLLSMGCFCWNDPP